MLRAVSTMRGWRSHLLMRDDAALLAVPTLFLWGDRDAFAPPASGEDMAARMPNAEFEVMPDTGHLPHVDQPDLVAAAIVEFLSHEARKRRLG
ncbi:MAG: alpha/beta fold hydrolase [Dehalococcoidia bacterium]